jgi:hypothetical protein
MKIGKKFLFDKKYGGNGTICGGILKVMVS